MFQLQLFFLLHCDEWDRVVALPRHKFVTGATLLQLGNGHLVTIYMSFNDSSNIRFNNILLVSSVYQLI